MTETPPPLPDGGLLSVAFTESFNLATAATTYYSADGGVTWETIAEAPLGDRINVGSGYRITARDRDRYAITYGGRRVTTVTTDGGRTFRTTEPGANDPDIVWVGEQELLAFSETLVARSTDGGATWTELRDFYQRPLRGGNGHVSDGRGGLLFHAGGQVYRIALTGGAATLLRGFPGQVIANRDLVPVDDDVAYVSSDAGLYRTGDGGASWTPLEGDAALFRPLLGSPAGLWGFQTQNRDLYLSTDGGQTWSFNFDLPTSGFNPIQAMFRAGDTGLVVQLSGGTFVSYDDGATWTQREATGVRASDGLDYVGAASAGTWIYQNGQGNSLTFQVTQDSGRTFTSPGTFGNQQRGAGAAAAEGRLFATRSFFSDDGFATTESFADSTGFEDVNLRDVWFRNRRHGAYHDGDGQRGYTTFDGGRTWQRDNAMVPRAITFRDTATALAYDPVKGLFRFSDAPAWPEVRLPRGGVSSVRGAAFAKTVRAFPNPVAAGGTLCMGGGLEQAAAGLYDIAGRRQATVDVRRGCVDVPATLAAGLYVLRLQEGVARVVVR